MDSLRAENLSKTFQIGLLRRRKVEALRSFSLSVQRGEIFGLLGPNGAGKTTLVKIFLSIVRPSSGYGYIGDVPISNTVARISAGYLPENHRYPTFLSAKDTLVLFGRLSGLSDAEISARIDPLLQRVGLADWKHVKIRRFSKGMLQRLGIAQALIHNPSVLFLDEPTDGVDPIGRKEIRDLLLELRAEGKTIFLNSHMLSEVEHICDRVAILNKGELIKAGKIDELTQSNAEYEFLLNRSILEEDIAKIRLIVSNVSAINNSMTARLSEPYKLTRVIDLLRSAGYEFHSINQKKASLEDSFIQLLTIPKDMT
ncbi:MAG: ABC transporter ATP-binding protein [Ignavibacteriales bacterium]|nr:ABC transporter ATP-binding protein [Ignavibacteriales bacterium]